MELNCGETFNSQTVGEKLEPWIFRSFTKIARLGIGLVWLVWCLTIFNYNRDPPLLNSPWVSVSYLSCLKPGTVLTTHHFLHNLRIGPKSSSFWPRQYSSAQGNLTLQLIGSIHKLWRKRSVVNMTPGAKPMAKFTHSFFKSSTISLLHIIFPGCWNGPSYKKDCVNLI
jgi:hypothetical protein